MKYNRAKSEGMEGGPPLLSRGWDSYVARRAKRNSVDKLESIANWKKI
jgi:hypothetical protein